MTTRPAVLIRRPDVLEALLPDDRTLTAAIQRAIDPEQRERSRVGRVRFWRIVPVEYPILAGLLRVYNVAAEVYSPPGSARPEPKSQAIPTDRDMLGVTEAAPWPVVESAYRAMALLYHPDRAGYAETERMKKINLAYERLQAGR